VTANKNYFDTRIKQRNQFYVLYPVLTNHLHYLTAVLHTFSSGCKRFQTVFSK
jgi:hypothetical protein